VRSVSAERDRSIGSSVRRRPRRIERTRALHPFLPEHSRRTPPLSPCASPPSASPAAAARAHASTPPSREA
jgi:hypothetical protein